MRRTAADGGASGGGPVKPGRSTGSSARPHGWGLPLLLAALFAALYLLGHRVEERHPEPGGLELGARRFLRRLVALGPRICGSEENERLAVKVRQGWRGELNRGGKHPNQRLGVHVKKG